MKYISKRIGAYLLDMLFITFVLALLNQISYLNWSYDAYMNESSKYQEFHENYTTEELISNENYKENVYNLSKYGQIYTIFDIVVVICYFVLFQKFNNGQTLGKRIVGLKIVNLKDDNPGFGTYFIRSFFLYSLLGSVFTLTFINFVSQRVYYNIDYYVTIVLTLVELAILLSIIFNKNGTGLHDKLLKTKVIEI